MTEPHRQADRRQPQATRPPAPVRRLLRKIYATQTRPSVCRAKGGHRQATWLRRYRLVRPARRLRDFEDMTLAS